MSPQELEDAAKSLCDGVKVCEDEGNGGSSDEGGSLITEYEMSRSEALVALIKSKGKSPQRRGSPSTTHKSKIKRPRLTHFIDSDSDGDVPIETRHHSQDVRNSSSGSSVKAESKLTDQLKRKRVREFYDSSGESENESQLNGDHFQRGKPDKGNSPVSNKPLKKNLKLMLDSDSESEHSLVMDLDTHTKNESTDKGSINSPPVNTLEITDQLSEQECSYSNEQTPGSLGTLAVSQSLVT